MPAMQTTPVRRIPVPDTEVVSMSSLTRSERRIFDNVVSPYGNPSQVLDRKIKHLARLLNCTEEEATSILLHNL